MPLFNVYINNDIFVLILKIKRYSIYIFYFFGLGTGVGIMVSLDVRRGENMDHENSLKFWIFDSGLNKYKQTTQVDNPHGPKRVTCLSLWCGVTKSPVSTKNKLMSSSNNDESDGIFYCASAAIDGTVKMWHGVGLMGSITSAKNSDKRTVMGMRSIQWTCTYSFQYRYFPLFNCYIFS
jgi:hypothetical protein